MANDKNYNEKRDFIRMKLGAPLAAQLIQSNRTIEGVCRDLSGGGMQVETKEPLDLGTELEIEMASSHGHSPSLKAKVKVARCEETSPGTFLIGLVTLELIED